MITIKTLTHHGMGRTDDGALIARTLPGETVTLGDDGQARIVTPSPHRVSPPCRHFKSCGGCAVQHADDETVAAWKVETVTRALAAHGITTTPRRMHTSPAGTRRRAKFSGRRTKKGALIGFHARASETIVPVPDCMVLLPAIRALIPALEDLTALMGSRKGEVAITITDSTAGADVALAGTRAPTAQDQITLAQWAQTHDIARLTVGDETIVTRRPPAQPFGTGHVTPPPGAFLQATRAGETALVASVVEALTGCASVADLFAGSGTFSLPLAARADVHAVEGLGDMLIALDTGWRHTPGLHRITTETRDLFRRPLDAADLARFDGIAIDPPRAGAQAQVREIAAHGPARVAYVSCNPVTFARDAATLIAGGYDMAWLDVIDQFRWSPHVELAAAFTRG